MFQRGMESQRKFFTSPLVHICCSSGNPSAGVQQCPHAPSANVHQANPTSDPVFLIDERYQSSIFFQQDLHHKSTCNETMRQTSVHCSHRLCAAHAHTVGKTSSFVRCFESLFSKGLLNQCFLGSSGKLLQQVGSYCFLIRDERKETNGGDGN